MHRRKFLENAGQIAAGAAVASSLPAAATAIACPAKAVAAPSMPGATGFVFDSFNWLYLDGTKGVPTNAPSNPLPGHIHYEIEKGAHFPTGKIDASNGLSIVGVKQTPDAQV